MNGRSHRVVSAACAGLLLLSTLGASGTGALAQTTYYDLPPLPPPETFGNVLIDRAAQSGDSKAVGFSHWRHRTRYACRVCHFELDFVMLTNASEITEQANREGRFCGACHDGKTAFGHTDEHCATCHTGSAAGDPAELESLRKLPRAKFGNQIDWVAAEERGLIAPIASILDPEFEPIPFEEEFELEAAWSRIPPADFSHNTHLRWLDCSNCHPELFKIEQEATENLLMKNILEGQFCGACHLSVAFPVEDCKRCHTKMRH